MNQAIEALQKIVDDESRPAEERKQAAEHILALQNEAASTVPVPTRRSQAEIDAMIRESLDKLLAGYKTNKATGRVDGPYDVAMPEPQQSVSIAMPPVPEPTPSTKAVLDSEVFWQFSQWKIGREAEGLPATVAEFVAERAKTSLAS